MAHSASSSTNSFKNETGVLCNCNRSAKIVRAWTIDNPGRRFYSCRGRKFANGYENCNFFRWFDVEKPQGWQHEALLEARNTIREQKEEIKGLRNTVRALTHGGETMEGETMENRSEVMEKMKQKMDEYEALKLEVLILRERSTILRNVLLTSSVGFVVVIGIMAMWKW
ncbi:uncharacterized protein LOC112087468 [Eutrema salsugineum]|uniref:uncharacterized protein LOC112087468 n=1 Tax=Eutrema salsugineum TaxID=72664 RepID=UPI000CECF8A4|nr:uncharacterized protein LOC112087468 [Eutrema salsugineum]